MNGTTQAILDHIRAQGYAVSAFPIPDSLHHLIPACTEMHAIRLADAEQFIAKVIDTGEEAEYRCACELAQMVGIKLEE